MIKHYKGKLGHFQELNEFDYDDNEWELIDNNTFTDGNSLHYIGEALYKENVTIEIPKGYTAWEGLFSGCRFKEGTRLINVDTTGVRCIAYMFEYTYIPKGFTLGDNFDTSKMDWTMGVFFESVIKEPNILGEKFCLASDDSIIDESMTSPDEKSWGLFRKADLPENMYFPENFFQYTSEAICETALFNSAKLPEDFKLGKNVKISHKKRKGREKEVLFNVEYWFEGAKVKVGNSLIPIEEYSEISQDMPLYDTLEILKYGLKPKNDSAILQECQKALLKLLKEGKTISEATMIVSNPEQYKKIMGTEIPQFDRVAIMQGISFISGKMQGSVSGIISDYLGTKENGYSKYTVGEIQALLLDKGFPRDIVNECIVNYLSNQYLAD